MQNDQVMNEDDDWLDGDDAPKVFFIMTGQYQVQTLMHEMKYKRIEMDGEGDESLNQPKSRLLGPGDLFGEVSLLYGCRRTATV